MLIDDGQIIVLGGLIQDSQTDGTQKLPFLGDIPIAGALFRYDTRKRSKTNLMVFLRPTIVRNPAIGGAITSDRYDYIIGEQRSIRDNPKLIPPVLPNFDDPQLPMPANPSMPLTPPQSPVPLPWFLPLTPRRCTRCRSSRPRRPPADPAPPK